jgi:predicted RNA binding protein YcfA (HicA-like mRNA interferase family)
VKHVPPWSEWGFVFRRQSGSHMILRRDQPYARAVVPDYKTLRPGTLRRIIADAGLTVEQLLQLLGRWIRAQSTVHVQVIAFYLLRQGLNARPQCLFEPDHQVDHFLLQ